jgi:hypothetical protein
LQWWPQIHANESASRPLIPHRVEFLLAASVGGLFHCASEFQTSASAAISSMKKKMRFTRRFKPNLLHLVL